MEVIPKAFGTLDVLKKSVVEKSVVMKKTGRRVRFISTTDQLMKLDVLFIRNHQ
jgi:hypothetical protein